MVLVQKWPFFQLFFLGNIGQKNVFYDTIKRKNAFHGCKNKKWKSRKIDIFPKGLTHSALVQKWPFYQLFFLGNIGQKNIFSDTIKRRNAFLAYKNKNFKKSKNGHFSRGVITDGFCPKMAFFPTFFFRQYTTGKWLLRYSGTKKRLSRL